jgi:hypothetical protein
MRKQKRKETNEKGESQQNFAASKPANEPVDTSGANNVPAKHLPHRNNKRGKRGQPTERSASPARTEAQSGAHVDLTATGRNQSLETSAEALQEPPPSKRGRRNAMVPGDAAYIAAVTITLDTQL